MNRITLKTVQEMVDGMNLKLAEKVHYLFMANYISYSYYHFRDESKVDDYCWCYKDLFELQRKVSLGIVNSHVIGFLDEWRQDAPSLYRKAKHDICSWITGEWYNFDSPMQKEIEAAYQAAWEKEEEVAIALALSPFVLKTAELMNNGEYEAAAGSCYAIFRCLAKSFKKHKVWFNGFNDLDYSYSKLGIFTESLVELYCHLRQRPDLSKRMGEEMNINLEVLNLETDLFGDMHFHSRWEDMLLDAKSQFYDYSNLSFCRMWIKWKKEFGGSGSSAGNPPE